MKLRRLSVFGLRSFTRRTEIDLAHLGEQGLFAICGPTGAGKSTILDGVFLALFGRTPRGEASECVAAGALELAVRLEIELDRREVAIERRFKWSRKRAAVTGAVGADLRGAPRHLPLRIEERFQGGPWLPADLGGRKAEAYLAEHLVKISMSDFQQAVVLPQGEFDALLRARPADRRLLVASLFRTEHLGAPLLEVLRTRENAVRDEMSRLQEASREALVSEAEANAAREQAEQTAAEAHRRATALGAAEQRATALQIERARCAARDAAELALAGICRELDNRADDRTRLVRARCAEGAAAAVQALESAEKAAAMAEARSNTADADARAAEDHRKAAANALEAATAVRAAELPTALERLGRARQAVERGRELAALDLERETSEQALGAILLVLREAEKALDAAQATQVGAEAAEREVAATLERMKVNEDDRAEAVASVAVAELTAGAERLAAVVAADRSAAEARVGERATALAADEQAVHAAEAQAARSRDQLAELEHAARQAADETEQAQHAFETARRAAAAADLASALRPGEACPVCGACDHPGADHRAAAASLHHAERALSAARRLATLAERARAEGTLAVAAHEKALRSLAARVDLAAQELDAARQALERQRSGEEVSRAVAEARAAVERLAARAELSLGGLPPERREIVRAMARSEPAGAAEARVAALNRRAREAEALGRTLAAAKERVERARATWIARGDELERAERLRAPAQARASTAASEARARHQEVAALLADLEPHGAARSPAEWVAELTANAAALSRCEEAARATLEVTRARAEQLALVAWEACVHRVRAQGELQRAGEAAADALARAGFESLSQLRAAWMEPSARAVLEETLERLAHERDRRGVVLAERQRDVQLEVSEADVRQADLARDEARREAVVAAERAVQATVRREELDRRRARAQVLRGELERLEPRARRLAQIRQVLAANQLAEFAAERHMEAVTRGAAAILAALSGERYALVRTTDGAFAVTDAAHGGIERTPSTLSGGESCLVSLALALALSERIQLAGRTRFDFFFLDEGFGALDPATLELALGALEKLRGPQRVIGMISHVGAIEERMPRRLRVVAERRGSATVQIEQGSGLR